MRQKRLDKKLEKFIPVNREEKSGGHKTLLYQKARKETQRLKKGSARDEKIWYVKIAYSPEEPLEIEIVAGELYRYWIGNTQPKTRLVTDDKGNRYVASEGVFNFVSFKDMLEGHIEISDYKTFARILVCSLLLQETDLKADNIGVNKDTEIVIKIDHDSSFWEIVEKFLPKTGMTVPNKIDFKVADLENILFPPNYKVTAWAGGLPKEVRAKLNSDPKFQNEVYFQILKTLLMPYQPASLIIDSNTEQKIDLKDQISVLVEKGVALLKNQIVLSKGFRKFFFELNMDQLVFGVQKDLRDFYLENRDYMFLNMRNILGKVLKSSKYDKKLSVEDLKLVVSDLIKEHAKNAPSCIVNFLLDQAKDPKFIQELESIYDINKLSALATELSDVLYLNANEYFAKPDRLIIEAYDELNLLATSMQKKDDLADQLKIDIHNPAHLKFWQSKTRFVLGVGGYKIILNNIQYVIPDRIAKIMLLDRGPKISFESFKDNINAIRLEKPAESTPFWKPAKDFVARNKIVEHFYNTPNIEDIVLEDSPQTSQEEFKGYSE